MSQDFAMRAEMAELGELMGQKTLPSQQESAVNVNDGNEACGSPRKISSTKIPAASADLSRAFSQKK